MSNETTVTLQGWVGGDVVLRRAGDVPVTSFRVACTPRRLSRRTGEWVDAPTQWYTVNVWRALAEHCAASLRRGDPVVVTGRINMRPYVGRSGTETIEVEVDALAVGHDLTRGTSSFTRAARPDAGAPAGAPVGAPVGAPAGGAGEQEAPAA
ncbi:single-stranded DNA-binding protein [Nocardioides sp. 1609]|uniref:single-stranded DNA-binding protein n=1 Tax=Nocardioides sp. 1609 TaxID=2508327 RepID=UPI00106FB6A5|nr:single-stranded DNA-binding protein [Nocardioides sp. 1609]